MSNDTLPAEAWRTNITAGTEIPLTDICFTEEQLATERILDVGCGIHALSNSQGPQIYGVDPFLGHDGKGVLNPDRAKVGVAELIPFADDFFHHSFSWKAVGFYPCQINLEQAVNEMLRVVKPENGTVRFNTGGKMDYELLTELLHNLSRRGYKIGDIGGIVVIIHPENDFDKIKFYENPFQKHPAKPLTDRVKAEMASLVGSGVLLGKFVAEVLVTGIRDDRLYFTSYSILPECPSAVEAGYIEMAGVIVANPVTGEILFKGNGSARYSLTTYRPYKMIVGGIDEDYFRLRKELEAKGVKPKYGK